VGQASEGCGEKTQTDINANQNTILNNFKTLLLAATAYHVMGSVCGKNVRFMLDTGAAISLISDQTWSLIGGEEASLANWKGHKLVGVEGSAIPVLGVAQNLMLVILRALKYGGTLLRLVHWTLILGLDFLENNQCCINTEQKVLHLKGRALPLNRDLNTGSGLELNKAKVVVQEQVILPPQSVMEVIAKVEAPVAQCGCVLLIEDLSWQPNLIFANALVTPQFNNEIANIPIRLLNTSTDPVVLHKGKAVACASMVKWPFAAVASTETVGESTLEVASEG